MLYIYIYIAIKQLSKDVKKIEQEREGGRKKERGSPYRELPLIS
jgi:hypothetical protein